MTPRTINHAIQDLKPGDWVIQLRRRYQTPVEVAKITPTQIHTWWINNHNGTDKYNRIDGTPKFQQDTENTCNGSQSMLMSIVDKKSR